MKGEPVGESGTHSKRLGISKCLGQSAIGSVEYCCRRLGIRMGCAELNQAKDLTLDRLHTAGTASRTKNQPMPQPTRSSHAGILDVPQDLGAAWINKHRVSNCSDSVSKRPRDSGSSSGSIGQLHVHGQARAKVWAMRAHVAGTPPRQLVSMLFIP